MGRRRLSVAEQLALDEAVARALQYTENKLSPEDSYEFTSISETAAEDEGGTSPSIQESAADLEAGPSNPPNDNSALRSTSEPVTVHQDDIDPDGMSYEELRSLSETVGSETRGLSDDLISYLPSSAYKKGFVLRDEHHECAICFMSYENQETLITLPCQHHYHSDCIREWLKINKACPVCKDEVFG